jgi:uncharacterized protein
MTRYARYAPSFTVKVNGEPLPTAMRASVISVRYQDGLEGADRVELTLANPGLVWLDHPLLAVDNGFELRMGYAPDPLETVFVGEITGVNATFPSGGMPTLTVVAHDFLQRLTVGAKDRAFVLSIPCIGKFPLPDPLIATLVGATNLLVPVVDPAGAALSFLTLVATYAIDPMEAKRSIRIQQNQSDFDFLSGLAKENGWEMFIDHTAEPKGYRLRFRFLIQPDPPEVVLRWGRSLTDFTPRISNVGQVVAVSARIWVAALKLELVVVLGWDYDRAAFDLQVFPGLGSLETVLGTKAKSTLVIDAVGPATVPKKLLSELLPRLNNRLTGSGTAVGDLAIKAGRVVQLDGLGEQFGGLYRITSSTHTIDGNGYQTAFDVRKEVWFDALRQLKGIAAPQRVRLQGQTIG